MPETMHLTVFLDGRPGHEKQSLAIVHELRQLIDLQVHEVVLPQLRFPDRLGECMQMVLTRQSLSPGLGQSTLLLGTGSRTHLVMLAAGMRHGVPVACCMAPDPLLRPFFSLCFVPRHDGIGQRSNVFFTDGPPVLKKSPATPLIRERDKGVVLVGGVDENSHYWDGEHVAGQIESAARHLAHVHWEMTSSPRTPATTNTLLEKVAKSRPNVNFTPFAQTERGWVEEQYMRSTYGLVTADSVSMLYEAVTSGCRVGVLPVRWKKEENKFRRSIDFLIEKTIVLYCDRNNWHELEQLQAGMFNEAKRCAEEIVQRIVKGKGNGR